MALNATPYSETCYSQESLHGKYPLSPSLWITESPRRGAFELTVFFEETNNRFVFDCPEIGVFAEGDDQQEAWNNFQEVLAITKEYLMGQKDESLSGKPLFTKRVFEYGYSFTFEKKRNR